MKKHFSTHWKSSRKPRKQVKYAANAPLHLRRKFMSTNLSKELRKKYGKRNLPLRKGDAVKIMKGKFRKKTGKIIAVYTKKMKVEVEGMQIKKQDGSKANVKFNPSFLQITELNLEDRKRNEALTKSKNKTEGEKNAP
ncbi:MAG: 50S ribosomal protein L24 [Candidatus Pacearchaeota archaeon]|nr:50S ribosomal protein L24 [Nanoarchaeota archaeon]MDZ4226520.1 50S ribosomal protein L24 [Candidatus Pacearchaeota archaeon]